MSSDCFYCKKDKALKHLMIEICSLKVSTLYLFRDRLTEADVLQPIRVILMNSI